MGEGWEGPLPSCLELELFVVNRLCKRWSCRYLMTATQKSSQEIENLAVSDYASDLAGGGEEEEALAQSQTP